MSHLTRHLTLGLYALSYPLWFAVMIITASFSINSLFDLLHVITYAVTSLGILMGVGCAIQAHANFIAAYLYSGFIVSLLIGGAA